MSDVLLPDDSLVSSAFSDAGLILFGLVLLLFGATLVLTWLLKHKPELVHTLVCLLCIEFLLLLGIVSIDLSGIGTLRVLGPFAQLSELLSTHRWLVIQLPFILLVTSIITLLTYGKTIVDRHARTYFLAAMISIWLSFGSIILIGFESML
jgi:hypothetical protein